MKRRLPWAAGAGLILSLILVAVYLVTGSGGSLTWRFYIDAAVYRAGGQFVLDGAQLYHDRLVVGGEETGFGETSLPFTYPPFAALLFVPLAWFSQTTAGVLLAAGNILLAGAVTWLLIDALLPARPDSSRAARAALITGAVLPLVLVAEPVRETIFFGQINLLLMLLVLLGTVARTPGAQSWTGGIFVGLAAAIKLTPAVFGLYFLVQRRWAAAAATFGSFLLFTGLAALFLPRDSVDYWTATLSDTGRIGGADYAANQSLKGLLSRVLGPEHPANSTLWLLLVLGLVGLITAAMLRLQRVGGTQDQLTRVALLTLASLVAGLCSPVSWSHHWVWLLPAVLVLVAAAGRLSGPERLGAVSLATITALVGLIGPHWLLPHRDGAEVLWPWWAQLTGSSYVVVGILLVFTALLSPRLLLGGSAPSGPEAGRLALLWSRLLLGSAVALGLGVSAAAVF